MKSHWKLAESITAILAAHASSLAFAAPPTGSQDPATAIEEITVTATRRSVDLQDVPISITALTSQTLEQLNVQTLDDFAKYLPGVSVASKGPGQNALYMRGLSTTTTANQFAGGTSSFPNVAIYLDDQSVQLPGRNLDVYAADLQRIEVLEGPQGTLFGAGAQAGTVRYITNKPNLDQVEAGFNSGYASTAHGDPSTSVDAFLNLPLIPGTLGVRAVIYDDSRGGYIRNVPGTFSRSSQDIGIVNYFSGVVPPGSPSLSNANLTGDAINPVTYKGMRLSALYQFNDDWSLSLQQSYQNMEADGIFSYNPALGDLDVQQYNPSYDKDKFEDTAWTLDGRISALKLVYTGGYLVRNVDQLTDYTAYARGVYAAYYQCNGPAFPKGTGTTNVCYSPSATWHDVERNTHQSHEMRASTPDEWRIRAIAGLFWEDYKIQDSANFDYGSEEAGFYGQTPLPNTTMFDPTVRPDGDVYFNDITRGYNQKAAFGELAYDLVPSKLTLTLGSRFYDIHSYEVGSGNSGYGCRFVVVCHNGKNLDNDNLRDTEAGHKNKVNVSWKVLENVMLYATYSEGFRPGGFNLGQGVLSPHSPIYGEYTIPQSYASDQLKNYEFGWKTSWFDHRLQFDGAIYEEKWENVQLSIFDPGVYGNLDFTSNGPNYRVRGVEGSVIFKPIDHLTVNSSFTWNSSEQTNAPSVIANQGPDKGQPISLFPTNGIGSPLAQAPPFQGNIRARYEMPFNSYNAYGQIAAQHTAHSYASVVTIGAFEPPDQDQAPYTTYDAALGVNKDTWGVELYGENLTDTRAQLYINGSDYVRLTTTNRPRTIGLRLSYRFLGEKTH